MALVFSLLAALLAILVQKWVRDYMQVFDRYNDPLKTARLRQYLYKGCEGLPMVAEIVPGCLHVSLFLFFVGLGNSLFNINTTIGISTIVPIGICGLLYVLASFLPIISPQSSYQTSFSGIIWFLLRRWRFRKYRDQGPDGESTPVDASMAQGRMELAMKETEARKDRDAEAIRWLIDNMTEDAEMEKLLSAIPGSFNTGWGIEVWNEVGKRKQNESDDRSQGEPAHAAGPPVDAMVLTAQAMPPVDRPYFRRIHSVFRLITHAAKKLSSHHSPATAHAQGDVVRELSERVNRSSEICKNPGLFEKKELWQMRTRACVETTALLVCCANAELGWFGDIVELLGDIGTSEKIRESSLAGRDQLFVMRWTYLSFVATQPVLEMAHMVKQDERHAIEFFERTDDTGNREALASARKIDGNLQKARHCLIRLVSELPEEEDLTEEVKEILRSCESEISELEQFNVGADNIRDVDRWIFNTQSSIAEHSHRITFQIPGVLDDLDLEPFPFNRVVELSCEPHKKRQFIRPGRALKSMCSPALTLRKILGGQGNANAYKELLRNLKDFRHSFQWSRNEIPRQVWRLQELCDGGGLGFTVELFFIALEQLLSTSSSKESHSALYMGTFKAITSEWRYYKRWPGTQKLLLDIAWSRRMAFCHYDVYIVDEFISLLGKVLKGQRGPHIDEAVKELESFKGFSSYERGFRDRLLRVITGAQEQSS